MAGESEITAFIKVAALTATLMWYARFASSSIRPGKLRLLALLPIILILLFLPWYFSTVHLRVLSGFLLVWLAPFKLLLLAFGLGPLSPSLSLRLFIAASSLHVKISPSPPPPSPVHNNFVLSIPAAIKVLALSVLIALYRIKNLLPHFLLLSGHCLHLYLSMDIILSSSAFIASSLLRLNLQPQPQPQFHSPLTSISFQEFWGRRWNLMATDILRSTVYLPIRYRLGTYMGIMASFVVSGIMHEVLFYYLTVEIPTGEAATFFVLHGVCTVLEVKGRKGGWSWPNPGLARFVVLGFVTVTCYSLLFQPLLRSGVDKAAIMESEALLDFFGDGFLAALRWLFQNNTYSIN